MPSQRAPTSATLILTRWLIVLSPNYINMLGIGFAIIFLPVGVHHRFFPFHHLQQGIIIASAVSNHD